MLNNQLTLTRHSIADLMYPVGSYYITESDELNTVEKMNAFFGGTWEQVTILVFYLKQQLQHLFRVCGHLM